MFIRSRGSGKRKGREGSEGGGCRKRGMCVEAIVVAVGSYGLYEYSILHNLEHDIVRRFR